MKKSALAVVLVGILAACGQQTSSSSSDQSQSSNNSQPSQTQPPASSQNTDQQDYNDWWNQLQQPFTALEGDVGTVGQLATEASQNPGELTTTDYQQRVQQACDQMNTDAQAILDIPESSNPKIAKMQDEINAGVKDVQYVAQNMPSDVDNLNTSGINACTTAFNTASSDFNSATQMLKDFKQQENMN